MVLTTRRQKACWWHLPFALVTSCWTSCNSSNKDSHWCKTYLVVDGALICSEIDFHNLGFCWHSAALHASSTILPIGHYRLSGMKNVFPSKKTVPKTGQKKVFPFPFLPIRGRKHSTQVERCLWHSADIITILGKVPPNQLSFYLWPAKKDRE